MLERGNDDAESGIMQRSYSCGDGLTVLLPVVKSARVKIEFQDIPWLRRACSKSGAEGVPADIAQKLVSAGLVAQEGNRSVLKITEKGRIALSKLG